MTTQVLLDTNAYLRLAKRIRPAVGREFGLVVADDLGMHTLAADFGLKVWHGFELLAKLRTAKVVSNDLVREIYDALERNGDMTETWRCAKHSEFARIFGE